MKFHDIFLSENFMKVSIVYARVLFVFRDYSLNTAHVVLDVVMTGIVV